MLKEETESYSSAKALMEAPVVGTQPLIIGAGFISSN